MFSKGDPIVHPGYGAGQITDIQTLTIAGMEKKYYHIELINGDERLMIPVDQADDLNLRAPGCQPKTILKILSDEPEELAKNYRTRQSKLQKKVYSGEPEKMAEALRDLNWREQQTQLAKVDMELKQRAWEILTSIMAVQNGFNVEKAMQRMMDALQKSIQIGSTQAG